MLKKTFTSIALATALGATTAHSVTIEDVEASFYP